MDRWPDWQWNEIQQIGTDYNDAGEVERYDRRMSEFRDLASEDAGILASLELQPGARVLEIGTGTGHFARTAARAGYRVTAIDVSPLMLDYARACAQTEGISGIEFAHAGFLTFEAAPGSLDAVVSVAVLHHLPDLWKAVSLQRVFAALRPGGRLVLRDVVFPGSGQEHAKSFDAFVESCPPGMRMEASRHIAKEYSTLDWIMEGLLVRAGFQILQARAARASLVGYVCMKP